MTRSGTRPILGGMSNGPNVKDAGDEDLAAAARGPGGLASPAGRRAFLELYDRYAARLLGYLSSRARRSDLEDVCQEVWSRVWQYLPERFAGGNFRAWLFQIAGNYLIDLSRKKKTEPLADEGAVLDRNAAGPEALLAEEERRALLAKCLEKLAPHAAQLVVSRLGGEAYDDICPRLGLTAAQAHKLLHTAKEQLQGCVERGSS